MVGIKPTLPLFPSVFFFFFLAGGRQKKFEHICCQFPKERDETWTSDRCLFEYQTEPRRPADGGQIAFQTGSSVWARSCRQESIFAPGYFEFFFFSFFPPRWVGKTLVHITVIITLLWCSSVDSRKGGESSEIKVGRRKGPPHLPPPPLPLVGQQRRRLPRHISQTTTERKLSLVHTRFDALPKLWSKLKERK